MTMTTTTADLLISPSAYLSSYLFSTSTKCNYRTLHMEYLNDITDDFWIHFPFSSYHSFKSYTLHLLPFFYLIKSFFGLKMRLAGYWDFSRWLFVDFYISSKSSFILNIIFSRVLFIFIYLHLAYLLTW